MAFREITPGHRAVRGPHRDILPNELLGIPTTDRLEVQEAVVVDVRHEQPKLVTVPGEHDPDVASGIAARDHIAVEVGRDFAGEAFTKGPHLA